MKKVICLVLFLSSFVFCFSQQKIARVTLKSGVSITGTIAELNPASHVIIQVAGVNSRIEMGDIASIEDISPASVETSVIPMEVSEPNPVLLDDGDFPETYTLKVGPFDIEMVLVRGAIFDMGYDGRGSLGKHSEPIHKVQLSSFYVNKAALSKDFVSFLKNKNRINSENDKKYSPSSWKDAQSVADALSANTNQKFSLITEAQCEYILTSDVIDRIDLDKTEIIWCYDYYDDYVRSSKPQVDPTGPREGRYHVLRILTAKDTDIYSRYYYSVNGNSIRVSIPASKLISQ